MSSGALNLAVTLTDKISPVSSPHTNLTFIGDSISPQTLSNASSILIDNNTSSNIQRSIASNIISNSTIIDSNLWLPKMDNIIDIFSICCSTAVIFGGLVPYIPQYLKIKRSMSSDGFSTYVCLTLLIANIMRILFWFGHHFELPLLIQSFVIIAGMLMMMEICIRVRDKNSSYVISAIGGGSSRRRRSLMGKLHDNDTHLRISSAINANSNDHEVSISDSESRPIYSVSVNGNHQQRPPQSKTSTNDLITTENLISINNDSSSGSTSNAHISSQSVASSSLAPSNQNVSKMQQSTDYSDEIIPTTQTVDGSSFRSSSSTIFNYNSLSESCQVSQQNPLLTYDDDDSNRRLKCCNLYDFWDWDDYFSYIKFLALFTIIMSLITYLFIDNYIYIETIGFMAVLTESMLGMPQLMKNFTKKSTRGMSVEMVVMWLSGDLFKTIYFVIRKAPTQFYICGSIQVLIDILILGQVFWYRRPIVTYRKLPKST